MINEELHKAMTDGVLLGVRKAVANEFNVYRQERTDMAQAHRTEDGLIEMVIAAEAMLKMIDELKHDA